MLKPLSEALRMALVVASTLVDSMHTASRESLRFATLAMTGTPFGERKSKYPNPYNNSPPASYTLDTRIPKGTVH